MMWLLRWHQQRMHTVLNSTNLLGSQLVAARFCLFVDLFLMSPTNLLPGFSFFCWVSLELVSYLLCSNLQRLK